MPSDSATVRPSGLRALLGRHAAAHPRRSAVVRDDVVLTYVDLVEIVDACAATLRHGGVTERSVVGVSVADEVQHLVVSVALLAIGAGQVTLATHDTEAVRAELARRVLVTDVVASSAEHRLSDTGFVLLPADLRTRGAPTARAADAGDDSGAIVYFKTSGTTGSISIVAFDQAQLTAQSWRHAHYAEERLLRLAPIEHNNSKRHRLYSLIEGGTVVMRDLKSLPVEECCRRFEVTCLDISRFHAVDLTRGGRQPGERLLDGIKLRLGGSRVPISLRRALEDTVTRELYVRYAATECGAISMAMPGEHDDTDPVGRPIEGVTVEVVAPDGAPLPRGTIGEIRLKAAGMASGYHNDPEGSLRRFRDGWFHPGDSASVREDGALIVHGRHDDMMILNGLNIYPAEIERVLEQHPAVRLAAALPIASDAHGQIPVAAVELHDGAVVTAAELQAWARSRLALRTPRRISVMASLPRTPQGKVAKLEIAALMRGARG